jgi:hypothetical protein
MKEKADATFVQFGCGWCAPSSWTNYDKSPTLRWERIPILGSIFTKNEKRFPPSVQYGDIVKGLPHSEGSVNAVYASHVLEHLALDDFRIALRRVYTMIKPSGTFRLVVPDLKWRAASYLENFSLATKDASGKFMRDCHLGVESGPKKSLELLSVLFGGSAHLWMWDELSMADELSSAGFVSVRRCAMGDAQEPEFLDVEDHGRFFDRGHPELAMEAKKPA